MTATDRDRAGDAPDPSDVATTVREAGLCQLLVRADGDALAAATLLASACDAVGTPYHLTTVRTREALRARLDDADPAATPIVLGTAAPGEHAIENSPVSDDAHDVAVELGATPDPGLTLAGVVAGGSDPAEAAPDLLESADADPEPGLSIPTDDLADGLAHTTLVHADFSGDRERVTEELDGLGDDPDPRQAASLLALAAAGPDAASDRAATAVERAIHPYRIEGPFATIGGYADVLSALSGRSPGLAVALAMSGAGRETALSAWRERAVRVHAAVRSAETARYSGLLVARVEDAPVEPVARLLRDFRSPEPVVLALSEGEAGIAAVDAAVAEPIEAGAEAAGGSALARDTRGYARFDADRADEFVEATRGAL